MTTGASIAPLQEEHPLFTLPPPSELAYRVRFSPAKNGWRPCPTRCKS